jgi:hypothetical protein
MPAHRRVFVLVLPQDPLKTYTSVTISSIVDTNPGDDPNPPCVISPTAAGVPVSGAGGHVVAVHYTFEMAGDGAVLDVEYAASYEPSQAALELWNEQVRTAQAAWDAQRADEAIERARRTIVAKSRIRPRPPADLREEERYELVNRFIASTFGGLAPGLAPSPVEIELFHRFFDVSSLFYWVHPSWWLPRAGIGRDEYEVTEDSEPSVTRWTGCHGTSRVAAVSTSARRRTSGSSSMTSSSGASSRATRRRARTTSRSTARFPSVGRWRRTPIRSSTSST